MATTAQNPTNRINRSIRFPAPVMKALKAEAKKRDRSVNWLVNQAVAKDLKFKLA